MNTLRYAAAAAALLLAACSSERPAPVAEKKVEPKPAFRVFVTNENSGELTVINGSTLEVMTTLSVGKRPRGIHASPDRKTIYVALSGSPAAPPGVDESTLPPPDKSADGIGVVDAESVKLLRTIKAGSDPEQFDLSRDGKLLFVSNEDSGETSIVEIDTGKVVHSVKVGEEPEGVTTSPDGKFVYVTSEDDGTVTAIDVESHKAIKTIKVGRRPRSVAFTKDGVHAYVTNENDGTVTLIDAKKHTVIRNLQLGEKGVVKPMCAILSPDGAKLYVSSGRGKKIFTVDTAKNEVAASVDTGTRPWGIDVSPDGKLLFAADGPAKEVVVVDLATQSVVKRIKAGDGPWGVLVLPN
ncbi:MAG: beta-propeller fold lactonase family protein [Bryobacterales bacterium]|nr:beta-propeller fold lactonase family protein [Bryobacterales bacterium]